jgi:hypothetical protein
VGGRTFVGFSIVLWGCLPSEGLKSLSAGPSGTVNAGESGATPAQVDDEGAPMLTPGPDGGTGADPAMDAFATTLWHTPRFEVDPPRARSPAALNGVVREARARRADAV